MTGENEGRKVVPAEEILGKIERGEPVEYKGDTIGQGLDIARLKLPKDEDGKLIVSSRILSGISKSSSPEIAVSALNNSTLLFTFTPSGTSPSFWECLYFSALSFAGGTPVGLAPIGTWKYAVMAESVLGYLFLALFIVVLARKLIR